MKNNHIFGRRAQFSRGGMAQCAKGNDVTQYLFDRKLSDYYFS